MLTSKALLTFEPNLSYTNAGKVEIEVLPETASSKYMLNLDINAQTMTNSTPSRIPESLAFATP
jgi:predicted component of type VI protein secretion system